jgi:heterotetrameric sarcosine oxidase gamma subunit
MADATTFLEASARPGRHGAGSGSAPAAIRIRERSLGALVQLTSWGQSDTIGEVAGPLTLDRPLTPGRVSRAAGDVRLYQLAPDRLWLNDDDHASVCAVTSQLDTNRFSELDLSSSRVVIEVSGSVVEDLMARLVAIDCTAEAFAPGAFALTALHEVSVLIKRTSADTVAIWVPITWAESLWSYVCVAAEPFGYEIVAEEDT